MNGATLPINEKKVQFVISGSKWCISLSWLDFKLIMEYACSIDIWFVTFNAKWERLLTSSYIHARGESCQLTDCPSALVFSFQLLNRAVNNYSFICLCTSICCVCTFNNMHINVTLCMCTQCVVQSYSSFQLK